MMNATQTGSTGRSRTIAGLAIDQPYSASPMPRAPTQRERLMMRERVFSEVG